MVATKRCPRCGETKALTEFSRSRATTDGLQSLCCPCHVASVRESRLRNPEVYRASRRRQYERNREAEREKRRAYNRANREKRNAQLRVHRAVKAGRLTKPDACSKCGTSDFRIEGHHEDYSRPLDVVWLCSPCHQRRHVEIETQVAA